MVTLKEDFSTKLTKNEAMQALIELVHQKKGRVLCKTDEHIKAKFGSMIIARILGLFLLNAFNKTLPFRLDVNLNLTQENLMITLCLSDNLGWGIRTGWGNSVYMNFFRNFIGDVKKALQPEGLTRPTTVTGD